MCTPAMSSDLSSFSSEHSSSEPSDLEETAEDRQFIADSEDEDLPDLNHSKKRRLKRKAPSSASKIESSDLDEEDLELIAENIQKRGSFRRLKNKDSSASNEIQKKNLHSQLEDLFDREEETLAIGSDEEEERGEDLDDFIVYEETPSEARKSQPRARKVPSQTASAKIVGKKKTMFSSNAWQDIESIFGADSAGQEYAFAFEEPIQADDDAKSHTSTQGDNQLSEFYEPSLLASSMITPRDEEIKRANVPERFLERSRAPVTPPSDPDELRQESLWISQSLLDRPRRDLDGTGGFPVQSEEYIRSLAKAVLGVLVLIREESYEVVFIATHRKEICQGILNLDDLWAIWDLDAQWTVFWSKKQKLGYEAGETQEDLENFILYSKCIATHGRETAVLDRITSFLLPPDELCKWILTGAGSCLCPDHLVLYCEIDKGLRDLASQVFGTHPGVRRWFITKGVARVTITTAPTEAGRRAIDAQHTLYPIKYLNDKPAEEYLEGNPEDFLLLLQAINNYSSLLSVQWNVDLDQSAMSDFNSHFMGTDEDLNQVRKEILDQMLSLYLIPYAKDHWKSRLTTLAMQYLGNHCRVALQERLMQSPFEFDQDYSDQSEVQHIVGLTLEDHVTYLSVISQSGAIVYQQAIRTEGELHPLLDQYSPRAIAIAGKSLQVRRLADSVNSGALIWISDDIARVYAGSEPMEYSASLALKLLNPLVEYANLWESGKICQLNLHHQYQSLLPPEELQIALERAFINVVNLVGVDLYSESSIDLIQFVCGLGKRKATLLASKHIEKRSDLSRVLGDKVAANCASFIRLSHSSNPLDRTRVHPESYSIARKMAANALDVEEPTTEAGAEDEDSNMILSEILEHSSKLDELDLAGFSADLEREQGLMKHVTLQDIKAELQKPFKVSNFIPIGSGASQETIFEMLTGEHPSTLEGSLVCGVVTKEGKGNTCFVRLDNGLFGMYTFSRSEAPLIGDRIVAQVTNINYERMSIDLQDMTDSGNAFSSRVKDSHFDWQREGQERQLLEEANRQIIKSQIMAKYATHSCYKPFNRAQAEHHLTQNGDTPGDYVVRPSSKGPDHLTLTLALGRGTFVHIDIEQQQSGLLVWGQEYQNLEEIADRLVYPLVDYVNEIHWHPKWIPGGISVAREKLIEQRVLDSSRIPWCFTEGPEGSGTKYLFCWAGANSEAGVGKVGISVYPKGFKVGEDWFEGLGDLVNWVKRRASGGR